MLVLGLCLVFLAFDRWRHCNVTATDRTLLLTRTLAASIHFPFDCEINRDEDACSRSNGNYCVVTSCLPRSPARSRSNGVRVFRETRARSLRTCECSLMVRRKTGSHAVKSDYCVDATESTALATVRPHTHTHANNSRVIGASSQQLPFSLCVRRGDYRTSNIGARTETGSDWNGNKPSVAAPDHRRRGVLRPPTDFSHRDDLAWSTGGTTSRRIIAADAVY